MHSTARRAAVAVLSAGALVLPLASPGAAADHVSDPLAEGLIGPLGLSLAKDGGVYVAEAFAGTLTRINRDGTRSAVATAEGGFLPGVDATRMAQAVYTVSGGTEEGGPFAELRRIKPNGETPLLADLFAFESEENPDADVHYGFAAGALDPECAAQVPEWVGGGAGYDGIIESNPYAVTATPGGWVVADAAGNSLVAVGRNGDVSALAVLPTHDIVLTAEQIAAVNAGLQPGPDGEPAPPPIPGCVAGETYSFEPVPTDVELSRDGRTLYVSTLAGGPEDPSLGPRSKVFTVDRRTGEVEEIASGLFAATDLAVSPDGTVYVAELFGGQISMIVDGEPEAVAEVPSPAAVEWHRGMLYATVDVFNEEDGGKLVMITP